MFDIMLFKNQDLDIKEQWSLVFLFHVIFISCWILLFQKGAENYYIIIICCLLIHPQGICISLFVCLFCFRIIAIDLFYSILQMSNIYTSAFKMCYFFPSILLWLVLFFSNLGVCAAVLSSEGKCESEGLIFEAK